MNGIDDDIETIVAQERALVLTTFGHGEAWDLGRRLHDAAKMAGAEVAIDITIAGQCLFHVALAGATPDNAEWIRRKRNVVMRFHRPSLAIGLALAKAGTTIFEKYGIEERDFAAHGGSFPIRLSGAGVIGAVTVSGLPQREDHAMVVAALAALCGVDNVPQLS